MQKITNIKKIEEAKLVEKVLRTNIKGLEITYGEVHNSELTILKNKLSLFVENMEYLGLMNKYGCWLV